MVNEQRFWNSFTASEAPDAPDIAGSRRFWDVFTATGRPDAYLQYRAAKDGLPHHPGTNPPAPAQKEPDRTW